MVFLFILTLAGFATSTSEVHAVCPVCTIAVGAGLGLSRYLGIDDSISGLWIGGLTLSMSFWLINWLKNKFKLQGVKYNVLIIIGMYVLVLLPLWYSKIIGIPYNNILGIDKVIFGTTVGSIAFFGGVWTDKKARKIAGRQFFQFQKVVFPISFLVIASLLIYYFGGYLYNLP